MPADRSDRPLSLNHTVLRCTVKHYGIAATVLLTRGVTQHSSVAPSIPRLQQDFHAAHTPTHRALSRHPSSNFRIFSSTRACIAASANPIKLFSAVIHAFRTTLRAQSPSLSTTLLLFSGNRPRDQPAPTSRPRLEAVEQGMAVRHAGPLFGVPCVVSVFGPCSRPDRVGPITFNVKCAGARSAGNPPATCEVAGAGNRFTVRIVRHSQRKRGAMDRPNLRNQRASPRPYPRVDALHRCDFPLVEQREKLRWARRARRGICVLHDGIAAAIVRGPLVYRDGPGRAHDAGVAELLSSIPARRGRSAIFGVFLSMTVVTLQVRQSN
jgi:hypothetical protein